MAQPDPLLDVITVDLSPTPSLSNADAVCDSAETLLSSSFSLDLAFSCIYLLLFLSYLAT